MTGLEYVTGLMEGRLTVPMTSLLGYRIVVAEPGRVVFEGRPAAEHYNTMGAVHGGYAATLLDSCMGCAVHTMLGEGMGYTTMELKISFIRAMTEQTGVVRAEGTVLRAGRRAGFAEARLVDAAGALLAHATSTCLVFPLKAPASG